MKYLHCIPYSTSNVALYTPTSACKFSLLFSHTQYLHGEFVEQLRSSWAGHNFFYSHDPHESFSSVTVRRKQILVILSIYALISLQKHSSALITFGLSPDLLAFTLPARLVTLSLSDSLVPSWVSQMFLRPYLPFSLLWRISFFTSGEFGAIWDGLTSTVYLSSNFDYFPYNPRKDYGGKNRYLLSRTRTEILWILS